HPRSPLFPYTTLFRSELGAIEFVAKPSSAIDLDMQSVKEDLLRKVRMAAKVRVVRTASRLASTIQNAIGSKTPSPAPLSTRPAPDRKSTRLNSSHVAI